MNNDLVNAALEQAKALQKTLGDAIGKGADQAHPLIDDAVAKANDLKDTLVHGAATASAQAKPHLDGALGHLDQFLAMGKSALATGVAKAHEQLEPLAAQVRKTIDATTDAMAKKPEDAIPEPDAKDR